MLQTNPASSSNAQVHNADEIDNIAIQQPLVDAEIEFLQKKILLIELREREKKMCSEFSDVTQSMKPFRYILKMQEIAERAAIEEEQTVHMMACATNPLTLVSSIRPTPLNS
ncbi:hypothetical protein M5D96_014221 [Drosophila gunungcola]|uniref:Uncharacterized protein n=1 Tax=Drosophila gunungcola TaxID=103775 RepID=A0A9P9Y9T8_9MUSC|nr:hypothetical protein M5D96_014221 [Drosophila gunungcola]